MSNLESAIQTLLSRLEQVTNRLEGVEKQLASGGAPAAASSGGSAGSAEAEASPSVVDFDALVQEHLKHFYDASEKIGAEVAKQAAAVKNAIAEQRKLLVIAAQSKKPDDKTFQDLLQPLSKAIGEVGKVKEESRSSKFPNNLATVSEGIAALGWVAVTPTPGPHINDMRGGSEFYSNRILKEFKGKDETQVSFVTGFNGFLKELFTFVKKHHTTGLSWNPRGGDAKAAAGSAGSAAPAAPAAPKAAGGPPPPPPPAALLQSAAAAPAQSSGPDMGNVFAAINKGTDVTSGLKKVTADMKSKNRTDKSSVVPAGAVKPKTETKAAGGAVKKGPPKIALEGNKWVVENQDNNFDIVIEATEAKQTVYVYRCDNSKIVIKGKINSITLDECKKSGVVFESAIASCEVVNCKSVEVQCTGKVPSYAVDKTSGFQLYLSAEGLESEIVTSKSDSMNVILPGEEDIIEMPIPEQYKTVVKGGKSLVTEAVQHV